MSAIDEYLESVDDPGRRTELERVRAMIARAAPDAVEGISYGIPAFLLDGHPLIGLTASAGHLSIHPFSPAVVDAVRDRLDGFKLSKGTIRFTHERPLPESILREVVARRRDELTGSG